MTNIYGNRFELNEYLNFGAEDYKKIEQNLKTEIDIIDVKTEEESEEYSQEYSNKYYENVYIFQMKTLNLKIEIFIVFFRVVQNFALKNLKTAKKQKI